MLSHLLLCFSVLLVVSESASSLSAEETTREQMYYRYKRIGDLVHSGRIFPHWMTDGNSFWYSEGEADSKVFYRVNPEANTKEPLFDISRLRKSLVAVLGDDPPGKGVPFGRFRFVDGEEAIRFRIVNRTFQMKLDTYEIISTAPSPARDQRNPAPRMIRRAFPFIGPNQLEVPSPDGVWFAALKDYDLVLRSSTDDEAMELTTDGEIDFEWGGWGTGLYGPWCLWSRDSSKLAVRKVDYRDVPKVPIVDWLQQPQAVHFFPDRSAGGPMQQSQLFIVDIHSKTLKRIDVGKESDLNLYTLGWLPDGSELLYLRMNRTFSKVDLMAADATTGRSRVILSESSDTFNPAWEGTRLFTLLPEGDRFIWKSERDGWEHIYLYGVDGKLIRQLSHGTFPVVEVRKPQLQPVVAVDDDADDDNSRWVYFLAHSDKERPYDTHLCRVRLDGTGFAQLTQAEGIHQIQMSPSKKFFLDSYSTTTSSTEVALRSVDGKLLQVLSKTNVAALAHLKWTAPEPFVVKAADGKTDLHGVLYRPYDFDPNKKYPLIERIYGGRKPVVPHEFNAALQNEAHALAQLGFMTFIVDGHGTRERGKAFEKVSHGFFRDFIPDHVATLGQLAVKYPCIDLERVGVYGGSWGGYATLRALLLASDKYHVGVAAAPGIDWIDVRNNEFRLGLPQENPAFYKYASNTRLAGNLKGKLLLVQGTSDLRTPLSGTMKMVNALTQAGKPYDLILLTGQNHLISGATLAYVREARRRYLEEHLKPVPVVELTKPVADAYFESGKPVTWKAKATPSGNAGIRRVEFLVDGSLVGTDADFPYEFRHKFEKNGHYVVSAKVYDSNGHSSLSTATPIFVGFHGLERSVESSADDAEQFANGFTLLNSSDVGDSEPNPTFALRFTNITMPNNARIKKAFVEFTVADTRSDSAKFTIHAELASDATKFRRKMHNISSRRKTTVSAKWTPEPWNIVFQRGEKQRTPDLSPVIQEVVAQPDWKSGNALVLIISGSGQRVAESFDGNPVSAPTLHVEYEP